MPDSAALVAADFKVSTAIVRVMLDMSPDANFWACSCVVAWLSCPAAFSLFVTLAAAYWRFAFSSCIRGLCDVALALVDLESMLRTAGAWLLGTMHWVPAYFGLALETALPQHLAWASATILSPRKTRMSTR